MVSPRKRSLVVRQMRSGPKTLQDSPEDWVSGSSFQFKESPVISKRVVESRRSNAFKRPPQGISPKKRRQSMILKRLELPSGSLAISPASSRRRTRRQSMAVMTSKVTLAGVPELTKSKVPKRVSSKANKSSPGKKSPKNDTPKKVEPQKITGTPKYSLKCSVSLKPLKLSPSPGKKGKEASLKRKVDSEATNKVDSSAKRLKRGLSEVSKETKGNSPGSKGESASARSPSVGKRKLRSEIPLKVDTSSKSKKIATKNISTPKSPSSSTGKSKSVEEKETTKTVAKSPKEGKSPKQDKTSAKPKQEVSKEEKPPKQDKTSAKSKQNVSKEEKSPKVDKVSATKAKQAASLKDNKSPRLDKISPKSKQKGVSVKTSPLSSKKSSSPEGKAKLTLKKNATASSEKKEVSSSSTKNEKLDKGKKLETSKSSPKVLTPPKLPKASLLVKKTGLSPASPKLRKSQANSGDPSPNRKLDKIKKTKTPKPDQKVALSSPKASPSNENKSASKQEKAEKSVPLKKKAASSPKVTPPQKKAASSPKVTPPQKQKEADLSSKDPKSAKKKTISSDTPDKKVKIKTPLSIKRLDSPMGGSIRLTRSSRRVKLVGKSPSGMSFKKTPKSKKQSTPKEKITDTGASPMFSARTQLNMIRCSSPLGRRIHKSPATKVKPFTPKPDSPPSNVLRKTMKKNVAQRMHATTKVEIHQLMNGEISKPVTLLSGKKIVTESITVTQTKVGGLNMAVTPRKALSSELCDGVVGTTVNPATPVSASNLPPTPTSSRKPSEPLRSILVNSESRISCRQSLLRSTPRSSTPIEEDDSIKPPDVDTIIEKETNFTDDSIDTDESEEDEECVVVMDNKIKDVTPEKPKRSYCSLM